MSVDKMTIGKFMVSRMTVNKIDYRQNDLYELTIGKIIVDKMIVMN
jgi:hypothetical protein